MAHAAQCPVGRKDINQVAILNADRNTSLEKLNLPAKYRQRVSVSELRKQQPKIPMELGGDSTTDARAKESRSCSQRHPTGEPCPSINKVHQSTEQERTLKVETFSTLIAIF